MTFFLDLSYKGRPIISHAGTVRSGNGIWAYLPQSFVDEEMLLPHLEGLDADTFRKSTEINWCAIRRTDKKGVCLLRGAPDRCGQGVVGDPEESQLKVLKLAYNTVLGGAVGHIFYGMLKVNFSFPLQHRWVPTGQKVPGSSNKMFYESATSLLKHDGFGFSLSALKDRVGGTVRVHLSEEEFMVILASLRWE